MPDDASIESLMICISSTILCKKISIIILLVGLQYSRSVQIYSSVLVMSLQALFIVVLQVSCMLLHLIPLLEKAVNVIGPQKNILSSLSGKAANIGIKNLKHQAIGYLQMRKTFKNSLQTHIALTYILLAFCRILLNLLLMQPQKLAVQSSSRTSNL